MCDVCDPERVMIYQVSVCGWYIMENAAGPQSECVLDLSSATEAIFTLKQ